VSSSYAYVTPMTLLDDGVTPDGTPVPSLCRYSAQSTTGRSCRRFDQIAFARAEGMEILAMIARIAKSSSGATPITANRAKPTGSTMCAPAGAPAGSVATSTEPNMTGSIFAPPLSGLSREEDRNRLATRWPDEEPGLDKKVLDSRVCRPSARDDGAVAFTRVYVEVPREVYGAPSKRPAAGVRYMVEVKRVVGPFAPFFQCDAHGSHQLSYVATTSVGTGLPNPDSAVLVPHPLSLIVPSGSGSIAPGNAPRGQLSSAGWSSGLPSSPWNTVATCW